MGPSQANGKTGELLRYVIGLALAAIVAYFSGQIATNKTIADTNERVSTTNGHVSVIESREQSHFEEVQRSLIRIERFMERIEATGADRRTGEPYAAQGQRR